MSPPHYNLLKRIKSVWLLVVKPDAFARLAKEHDANLPKNGEQEEEPQHVTVRRLFFHSLGQGTCAVGAGTALGLLLRGCLWGCTPAYALSLIQMVSAGLLLLGALFVLEWQEQSIRGNKLAERTNRWMYRGFLIVGTFCLFVALSWSLACPT